MRDSHDKHQTHTTHTHKTGADRSVPHNIQKTNRQASNYKLQIDRWQTEDRLMTN